VLSSKEGHEGDHSSPSSAKVKNGGAMPPLPNVFMTQYFINYAQGLQLLPYSTDPKNVVALFT
jgi:hypothetical protein